MLVWIGDVTEGFRPCDSLVRLQILNSSYVIGTESRESLLGNIVKPSPDDLPLCVLGVGFGVFDDELRTLMLDPRIRERKFIDQVVKSSAEVVENITQDDRKGNLDRPEFCMGFRSHGQCRANLYRNKIVLGNKVLLIFQTELFDDGFQFLKVFTGPVDPGIGSG